MKFKNQIMYVNLQQYDGYRVSSDGTIESCWSNSGKKRSVWKAIKPDVIKGGYLRVRIRSCHREYVHKQVSHLMLEAFVGDRPEGQVACHCDGNPANNSIDNLRWDTRSGNEDDKRLHGTHQTGEGNPAAKLTDEEVIEMRRLRSKGWSTYKLAKRFAISRPVAGKIVKHQLWRHI